jgi:hypothetical protein
VRDDSGVKLYADRPARTARQLLTDLLAAGWIYAWIRAGIWVYDLVSKLAAPGRGLEHAGTGLADNLANIGRKIDKVPAAGGALASPFGHAADAARTLAAAGRDQQAAVHDLALILVAVVVGLPLCLVLFGWLPLRVRWIRRASAAAALRQVDAGRDLLALRALTGQPLRRLVALDADIAAAWRRGDPAAIEALSRLELTRLGLRSP